jgi:glutamine phosphoribosylpyrophosphate amidotransferase
MAVAPITPMMMGVNGPIQNPDLQFQSSELIDDGLQRLFHRGRKSFAITLVCDDRGKLGETFASRLRNEAELGKVGSERIDQLRALTD